MKTKLAQVKFFNIKYDTDGESVSLPTELIFSVPERISRKGPKAVEEFIDQSGADMISDRTGWCVFSFDHSIQK